MNQALMNPTWACPPCRGFCNCSICRFVLSLTKTDHSREHYFLQLLIFNYLGIGRARERRVFLSSLRKPRGMTMSPPT